MFLNQQHMMLAVLCNRSYRINGARLLASRTHTSGSQSWTPWTNKKTNFSELFWTCSRNWRCPGIRLEMSWKSPGSVRDDNTGSFFYRLGTQIRSHRAGRGYPGDLSFSFFFFGFSLVFLGFPWFSTLAILVSYGFLWFWAPGDLIVRPYGRISAVIFRWTYANLRKFT